MSDRRLTTHGPGCWGGGLKHYECAVAEIERLREQLRLATVDQATAEAEASDAHAEIERLHEQLRRETERRWEGNRRAAQEYVDDMRDVLKEAARICKDLDDEALAKEGRLACGAECAAAIADLAARMNVHCEVRAAMAKENSND